MTNLPPDQLAWLPVARQVIAGEFENADSATKESIRIGLRSTHHELAEKAMLILDGKGKIERPKPKPEAELPKAERAAEVRLPKKQEAQKSLF